MMNALIVQGQCLVEGKAQGAFLFTEVGLSFWGGVDPATGEIIDQHHPLCGQVIKDCILAIPSGRGSCTGSSVLLELILNGHAPAGLVLAGIDEILALGVVVANALFSQSIPVINIGEQFNSLPNKQWAILDNNQLTLTEQRPLNDTLPVNKVALPFAVPTAIKLMPQDQAMLQGEQGKAAQAAMQIIVKIAELQGATELFDIQQAHIDGCIYTGSACLKFAKQLADWGGKVKVPTSLNSISVDHRHWRALGVDPSFGEPASQLADAYLQMGAKATFTCAPYLLDTAPKEGEQIVWAESNAVVYANSVLGARTLKYPDFLDICIALTGRAPLMGCHLTEGRAATIQLDVPHLVAVDDSFYPLLGYYLGTLVGSEIPVITGLTHLSPTSDDLKAFGAAFATTSAAPMFHIVGVTPEAKTLADALQQHAPKKQIAITGAELLAAWHELNSTQDTAIDLVSLGNPHFSLSEFERLAALTLGKTKQPYIDLVITCGRAIAEQAEQKGYLQTVKSFGAKIVMDTCWCMLGEPIIPPHSKILMTNSGKYAHYGPGLAKRLVRFGSLEQCVEAAITGQATYQVPLWLNSLNEGER